MLVRYRRAITRNNVKVGKTTILIGLAQIYSFLSGVQWAPITQTPSYRSVSSRCNSIKQRHIPNFTQKRVTHISNPNSNLTVITTKGFFVFPMTVNLFPVILSLIHSYSRSIHYSITSLKRDHFLQNILKTLTRFVEGTNTFRIWLLVHSFVSRSSARWNLAAAACPF